VLKDDYKLLRGTSFAAPLVAGIAALLLSAHPMWTNAELRDALLSTAYWPSGLKPNYQYIHLCSFAFRF
jgi:subtilisin family serine protease